MDFFSACWNIKKVDYQKSNNNSEPWGRFQTWKYISNYKHRDRVYCEESGESQTVNDIEESRLILSIKKLCVNSVRNKHWASKCLGNRLCVKSKGKHHSSICDKTANKLLTTSSCSVTYPVFLIEIEGLNVIRCAIRMVGQNAVLTS